MAKYTVKDKKSGRTVTFNWKKDTPPTAEDMQRVFSSIPTQEQKPPGVGEALFPRTSGALNRDAGIGQTAASIGGDVLSGVMRVPAAVGRTVDTNLGLAGKEGQSFTQSLDQINRGVNANEEESVISRLERSPGTVAGAAVPFLKIPGVKGLAGKMLSGGLTGGAQGTAAASAEQASRFGEGKEFDPKKAFTEIAWGAGTGAALPGLGELGKGAAKKIINTALKPGRTGTKLGFKLQDVFDQKVTANTLNGMAKKTSKAIEQESQKAQRAIMDVVSNPNLPRQSKTIQASDLLEQTAREFQEQIKQGKMAGDAPAIQSAIESYKEAIDQIMDPKNGDIALDIANNLKRSLQQDAKRLYQAANIGGSTDASAKAQVARSLAAKIRQAIEQRAPGVVEPNRNLAKLLPIDEVVDSRLIIAGQNQGLGLGGIMSGGFGVGTYATSGSPLAALAIPALYQAQKSPAVAQTLYKLGQGAQKPAAQTLRFLAQQAATTNPDSGRVR